MPVNKCSDETVSTVAMGPRTHVDGAELLRSF
jgi:hypothetical protein